MSSTKESNELGHSTSQTRVEAEFRDGFVTTARESSNKSLPIATELEIQVLPFIQGNTLISTFLSRNSNCTYEMRS